LNGELKVAFMVLTFCEASIDLWVRIGRRRGDTEAAWFGSAGDVDIEPLSWKEL
jgi:hypothetical protein